MKPILFAAALALTAFTAGSAFAESDDAGCTAAMAEWQPREALQQKLESEGWKVRRVKTDDGCYEVYAFDPQGKKVEALFDPKTFEMVGSENDDD